MQNQDVFFPFRRQQYTNIVATFLLVYVPSYRIEREKIESYLYISLAC